VSDSASGARRFVAPALAGLTLLLLWGPLASWSRLLAARDVLQFFLPLRDSLVRLAALGFPEWNPWIQGGQPLLSDPSYAAWYPPTWLAFAVGAARSLGWGAFLHAAWAAVGAYLLARRLGARGEAAALGALGYAAGGPFVSLLHAAGHFSGAAWLPWTLLATDHLARVGRHDPAARRSLFTLALVGAALLLNGEPVTLIAQALAAVVWLLVVAQRRRGALGRALAAALIAAGLAAVQLLPALVRLTRSARAGGLGAAEALDWSLAPIRLGELLVPHLLGDPARVGERLWFGWGLVDRDFPFVLALAPGLPLLVLALFGWLFPGTRKRGLLALLAGLGVALALGRHLPLLPTLRAIGFPFSAVRFPEKFVFLTGAAIAWTAALALERVLADGERGERRSLRQLERVAGGLLGLFLALAALVLVAPPALAHWLQAHSGPGAGDAAAARALAFHRHALVQLVLVAAAVFCLVALVRRRRLPLGALAAGLVLVAGLELLALERPLLPTLPLSALAAPPPLARAALDRPARLWSQPDAEHLPAIGPGGGLDAHAQAVADRLDPASGVIWGLSYALSSDYARTLTPPARRALEVAQALLASDPAAFRRWAGAWSVGWMIEAASDFDRPSPRSPGAATPLARLEPLAQYLPEVRWVAAATSFDDDREALARALAAGLPLASHEYLLSPPAVFPERYDDRRSLEVETDTGSRVEVAVGPGDEALLVVARTWDPDWHATSSDGTLPVLETAAGYFAVPVPARTRHLTLAYRDPWIRIGAAVTATTVALLLLSGLRRRRHGASASPAPHAF